MSPDTKELLETYAKSKKITMMMFLDMLIEYGVDQDVYDPKWREKIQKQIESVNRYASLDGACPALAGGKKSSGEWLYRCVWFRPDNPPNIKNLGDSEELQGAACFSCGGTKPFVEGIEERDQRIRELEVELGSKSTERFKIPKCNRGAVLNHDKEDQLIFTGCFRHRGEPVSVDKFCRVYSNGLPCSMFAELVVGVEGKKT